MFSHVVKLLQAACDSHLEVIYLSQSTYQHVFTRWEENGEPGRNPCGHEEITELDTDGNLSSGSNRGAARYTRTHVDFLMRVKVFEE